MLAPCRFKEWSAFGLPVGRPVTNPLVQVSAVTQEQSYNTGDMFPILLTNKCIREYGVKPGIDLVRARNGRAKIQMITSSPRAMEGKRVTFAVLNEVFFADPILLADEYPEVYARFAAFYGQDLAPRARRLRAE